MSFSDRAILRASQTLYQEQLIQLIRSGIVQVLSEIVDAQNGKNEPNNEAE